MATFVVVSRVKEDACLVSILTVSRKTKGSQWERQETTIAQFATPKATIKVLVCRLVADTFSMLPAYLKESIGDGLVPVSSSIS